MGTLMAGTIWWDFDGTLVSRPRMWSEAALRLATRLRPGHDLNVSHFARQFKRKFPWHRDSHPELTGERWWLVVYDVYRSVFQQLGLGDVSRHAPEIREDILDASRYRVFEDVVPVLDALARDDWRHLIVSNHVPELSQIARDLGIGCYFDSVVTSGQVGYEKPHRRMFEAAVEHTRPGAVWMVGDNLACDCLPVAAFGANAILVRSAGSGYQLSTENLRAAADLIKNTTMPRSANLKKAQGGFPQERS